MSFPCPGLLLDATKCGSGAYRNMRLWQNLMPQAILAAVHARIRPPTGRVEKALEDAGLSNWSTYPIHRPTISQDEHHTPPREPLPYLAARQDITPFRIHNGIPCHGILYYKDTPATPCAEIRESLMGFQIGDTAAPGLAERVQLLGQCRDLNTMT